MNRLRLKNPIVLMPVINMAGAVSTFVYFYFIFPRVTAEKQLPWQYSVLFFLGGSLVLFLFFILLRKGSLRELFDVAEGRTDIATLEPHDRMYHQRAALQLPLTLTAVTFGVWILAGFIFGFLDPVIASHFFDVPMQNLVLCLRQFFGITILGGGVTCIVQFLPWKTSGGTHCPIFS